MTKRKDHISLRGERTPQFVDRETGAAELCISPETWDRWVADGRIPPCEPGFPEGSPRWKWDRVERKLLGETVNDIDAFVAAAKHFVSKRSRRRRTGGLPSSGSE
jgi:hypothetical protein